MFLYVATCIAVNRTGIKVVNCILMTGVHCVLLQTLYKYSISTDILRAGVLGFNLLHWSFKLLILCLDTLTVRALLLYSINPNYFLQENVNNRTQISHFSASGGLLPQTPYRGATLGPHWESRPQSRLPGSAPFSKILGPTPWTSYIVKSWVRLWTLSIRKAGFLSFGTPSMTEVGKQRSAGRMLSARLYYATCRNFC